MTLREAFPRMRQICFKEAGRRVIQTPSFSFSSSALQFTVVGYGYGKYKNHLMIQASPEKNFGYIEVSDEFELLEDPRNEL
eukprot:14154611-Heterocapsa_arctica.AAC.1